MTGLTASYSRVNFVPLAGNVGILACRNPSSPLSSHLSISTFKDVPDLSRRISLVAEGPSSSKIPVASKLLTPDPEAKYINNGKLVRSPDGAPDIFNVNVDIIIL